MQQKQIKIRELYDFCFRKTISKQILNGCVWIKQNIQILWCEVVDTTTTNMRYFGTNCIKLVYTTATCWRYDNKLLYWTLNLKQVVVCWEHVAELIVLVWVVNKCFHIKLINEFKQMNEHKHLLWLFVVAEDNFIIFNFIIYLYLLWKSNAILKWREKDEVEEEECE